MKCSPFSYRYRARESCILHRKLVVRLDVVLMHDALCCSKESRDSAAREEQRTKMQTMLATAQEATQAQHGVAAICKPAVDSGLLRLA